MSKRIQAVASEVKASSRTIGEGETDINRTEQSVHVLKKIGNSIYIDLLDQVMNALRNDLHALYPRKYEDRDVLNNLLVRHIKNMPFDMAVQFVLKNEEWRVYSARSAIRVIDQYKSVIRPPSAVSAVTPTYPLLPRLSGSQFVSDTGSYSDSRSESESMFETAQKRKRRMTKSKTNVKGEFLEASPRIVKVKEPKLLRKTAEKAKIMDGIHDYDYDYDGDDDDNELPMTSDAETADSTTRTSDVYTARSLEMMGRPPGMLPVCEY